MLSTVEFFDLVKHTHNLPSDYALAKRLGVTPALISKHRYKKFGMSDAVALKIADLLDYEHGYVLLCACMERAKCTKEKAAYCRLAGLALAHSRELKRH